MKKNSKNGNNKALKVIGVVVIGYLIYTHLNKKKGVVTILPLENPVFHDPDELPNASELLPQSGFQQNGKDWEYQNANDFYQTFEGNISGINNTGRGGRMRMLTV